MSEIKKIEDGKVEIVCTIDGEEWKKANTKAFKKVLNKLQIKGFRKGQVPESLAKKYISDKEIQLEAVDGLTDETFKKALDEHDVDLIDRASLDIKEIDNDHVVLSFTCPVKPDVVLGDYKSIKYELENVDVSDEELEASINRARERKADLEIKEDGTVESGDTAVIDFEGYKDGVPFDGGKAENYELVIGSNSFIPGFEDQMIGMKPEEEKDINVTFPEDYHVDDLKGAPVVFKVKVHEIKRKVLPELNDEFVKELNIENVNTVDEYRAHAKEALLEGKKAGAESKAEEEFLEKIKDICVVNIPDIMIENEVNNIFQEQAQNMAYQGISMDQYMKLVGQNEAQIKENLKPAAADRVKIRLCLEAIGAAENIEVSSEDIDKYYSEMAERYSMKIDDIKKFIRPQDVKKDLKISKTLDLLKNNK